MPRRLTPRRKVAVLHRVQAGRCFYCDGSTWLRTRGDKSIRPADSRATIEHLVRRAEGGGHEMANLRMACAACNTMRDKATPEEHRAAMQKLVAADVHPTNRSSGALYVARRRWKRMHRSIIAERMTNAESQTEAQAEA